jgi:hypothetical protein
VAAAAAEGAPFPSDAALAQGIVNAVTLPVAMAWRASQASQQTGTAAAAPVSAAAAAFVFDSSVAAERRRVLHRTLFPGGRLPHPLAALFAAAGGAAEVRRHLALTARDMVQWSMMPAAAATAHGGSQASPQASPRGGRSPSLFAALGGSDGAVGKAGRQVPAAPVPDVRSYASLDSFVPGVWTVTGDLLAGTLRQVHSDSGCDQTPAADTEAGEASSAFDASDHPLDFLLSAAVSLGRSEHAVEAVDAPAGPRHHPVGLMWLVRRILRLSGVGPAPESALTLSREQATDARQGPSPVPLASMLLANLHFTELEGILETLRFASALDSLRPFLRGPFPIERPMLFPAANGPMKVALRRHDLDRTVPARGRYCSALSQLRAHVEEGGRRDRGVLADMAALEASVVQGIEAAVAAAATSASITGEHHRPVAALEEMRTALRALQDGELRRALDALCDSVHQLPGIRSNSASSAGAFPAEKECGETPIWDSYRTAIFDLSAVLMAGQAVLQIDLEVLAAAQSLDLHPKGQADNTVVPDGLGVFSSFAPQKPSTSHAYAHSQIPAFQACFSAWVRSVCRTTIKGIVQKAVGVSDSAPDYLSFSSPKPDGKTVPPQYLRRMLDLVEEAELMADPGVLERTLPDFRDCNDLLMEALCRLPNGNDGDKRDRKRMQTAMDENFVGSPLALALFCGIPVSLQDALRAPGVDPVQAPQILTQLIQAAVPNVGSIVEDPLATVYSMLAELDLKNQACAPGNAMPDDEYKHFSIRSSECMRLELDWLGSFTAMATSVVCRCLNPVLNLKAYLRMCLELFSDALNSTLRNLIVRQCLAVRHWRHAHAAALVALGKELECLGSFAHQILDFGFVLDRIR